MDRSEVVELMRSHPRYPFNLDCLNYEPLDSDVFVCAWPKCGQTWTLNIVWSLLHDGEALEPKKMMQNWYEMCSVESLESLPSPRVIKTHLPLSALPFPSKAKFIFVTRNPKDAAVSFFKHQVGVGRYEGDQDFLKFWEEKLGGEMKENGPFGSFFTNTLSFLEHKDDPNLEIIVYEEMRKNPVEGIRKIANFLGIILTEELLTKTLHNSSMDSMRTKPWKPTSKEENSSYKYTLWKREDFSFIREGAVSGWRNVVPKEASDKIDELFEKYFVGTPAESFWDPSVLEY